MPSEHKPPLCQLETPTSCASLHVRATWRTSVMVAADAWCGHEALSLGQTTEHVLQLRLRLVSLDEYSTGLLTFYRSI